MRAGNGVDLLYAVNQGPTSSRQLFIADTSQPGSPSALLPTTVPAGEADWSSTGAKIVFVRAEFPGNLYTIKIRTGRSSR